MGLMPPGTAMKIGLVIYGSLDLISGGYLYDRLLVDYLRKQGTGVEILSLPWRNYWRHLTDNFSGTLPRAVEALAPDLLLQDELNHPSLFHTNRKLQKTLKGPIIAIVHHLRSSETRPAWLNRLYRLVEKRFLETVDGFIFNSETTRAVTMDILRKDTPSIVAYPGGDHLGPCISAKRIVERCSQPGPLKILFMGNVIPRKGLHTLILALSHLLHESWQLTVAGSLSANARYVKRVGQLIVGTGLEERVKLLDTVPPKQLVGLLESHHCLAIPSFYEGFGIAYLEAMGFGVPVVATSAGAVPEVINDGREGFLVSPGDVDALTEAINRLIRDRNLLLTMSLAAWKRSLGHPTWAENAARVEEFLHKTIHLKKAAAKKGG
jgi:glycosyltransferase involved in cell wall biosynthesis